MKPADRVLLTSLVCGLPLRALALRVADGALVGLGTRDEVAEARRACADLDHVMFVEGSREEIPWVDAWFDVILDCEPGAPTQEMLRVLKPGGRIADAGAVSLEP
jgi:SAM-dependent methyltransferase